MVLVERLSRNSDPAKALQLLRSSQQVNTAIGSVIVATHAAVEVSPRYGVWVERSLSVDRIGQGGCAGLRDRPVLTMSQLERAVEVMDRLRSPGGCPWDAEQTHESLARYLLEETYEVLEAIERADRTLLREELGDLLLQVLFHARLAEEEPEPYSIEDVAADLVDKLVRRHPHVFADGADRRRDAERDLGAAEDRREGPHVRGRRRAARAAGAGLEPRKLVSRANRAGLDVPVPDDDEIGARLFAIVQEAVAAGIDPETALRRTTRAYRDAILAAETQHADYSSRRRGRSAQLTPTN